MSLGVSERFPASAARGPEGDSFKLFASGGGRVRSAGAMPLRLSFRCYPPPPPKKKKKHTQITHTHTNLRMPIWFSMVYYSYSTVLYYSIAWYSIV